MSAAVDARMQGWPFCFSCMEPHAWRDETGALKTISIHLCPGSNTPPLNCDDIENRSERARVRLKGLVACLLRAVEDASGPPLRRIENQARLEEVLRETFGEWLVPFKAIQHPAKEKPL